MITFHADTEAGARACDGLHQTAPDRPLLFFRPREFGTLVSLLGEGNSDAALRILNDIATRDECCVHTVMHEHEYGVAAHILIGAAMPNS